METKKPRTILLSSSANMGTGLWTMICLFFCKIFGRESRNYRIKVNKAMNMVKNRLAMAMSEYPEYDFEDFRVVKEKDLSFIGTVLGTLREEK